MKSPDDAYYLQWDRNPEPDKIERSPQIILDAQMASCDAYLWESHNSTEGWLKYDGNLVEITE